MTALLPSDKNTVDEKPFGFGSTPLKTDTSLDQAQDKQDKPDKNSENVKLSSELQHVTEEMYKRNSELALTNKTLSILQKIDTIILSSVTDLQQVSQQIVDIILEEVEFRCVSIYIIKKDEGLNRLASSEGEAIKRAEYLVKRQFPSPKIAFENKNNIFVKAIKTPGLQITNNYLDLLTPAFNLEEAALIQRTLNVKSVFVYPLIVRSEIIGTISISTLSDAAELLEYEQDLINRLVDIIGIAIDNSLLYKSIQEANIKLKELDRLKDEFVSFASHELRTPMTVIKSYVWMLLNGKTGTISEKQKEYLEHTYSSIEGLINLVNNILNISRIESGGLKIEPVATDIVKLIDEVVTEMEPRANEIGVHLLYTKPPQTLITDIDPGRIKEVVINLIGNSIKFTPKDGSIFISLAHDNQGFVNVKVKDTGRGISPEDMHKLFQKFNMVGESHLTKDRGQGTGLGLYLSKVLVELHGGKIWAESGGEGTGTTFSFTVPETHESK